MANDVEALKEQLRHAWGMRREAQKKARSEDEAVAEIGRKQTALLHTVVRDLAGAVREANEEKR